jgi:hypothetical protein
MSIQHSMQWQGPGSVDSPRRKILSRLTAAGQYARMQLADPVMRAEYESRVTRKRDAYGLAVTDFLIAPKICSVSVEQYTGHAGEPITVHVEDDFKVAGVRVELLDIEGKPVETGEAREDKRTLWRYKTKQIVGPFERLSVVVTAYDIPGNMAMQTTHLTLGPKPGISKSNIEP